MPIPIYNGLRKRFELPDTEKASLTFEQDNIYDRRNGLMIETMKNICVKDKNDNIVGKIDMQQPLKQLYMSESHIVDNLNQVGFKNLVFFDISYDEGHVTIEKLDEEMTESEETANVRVLILAAVQSPDLGPQKSESPVQQTCYGSRDARSINSKIMLMNAKFRKLNY